MPTAVVLLSGGLDSYTAAAVARRDGFDALRAQLPLRPASPQEIEAARRGARALGVDAPPRCSIWTSRAIGGSSLTSSRHRRAEGPRRRSDAYIPSTYVPARNTIFLSLALGWAEVLGAAGHLHRRQRARLLRLSRLPAGVHPRLRAAGPCGHAGRRRRRASLTMHTPLIELLRRPTSSGWGCRSASTTASRTAATIPRRTAHPVATATAAGCALAGFAAAGVADPAAALGLALTIAGSLLVAQPLRRQVILTALLLGVAVVAALGYAARLTYVEQVAQLQAEPSTMASTVVVYREPAPRRGGCRGGDGGAASRAAATGAPAAAAGAAAAARGRQPSRAATSSMADAEGRVRPGPRRRWPRSKAGVDGMAPRRGLARQPAISRDARRARR